MLRLPAHGELTNRAREHSQQRKVQESRKKSAPSSEMGQSTDDESDRTVFTRAVSEIAHVARCRIWATESRVRRRSDDGAAG